MSIKKTSSVTPVHSTNSVGQIARELSGLSCIGKLDDLQLSDGLISGSIKSAAVLACSDMGCLVPYVCSSPDVRLFLFQNFGHDSTSGGFVETIIECGIEHVIVYGHALCDYTKFLAESGLAQHANDAFQSAERKQQLQLYSAAVESNSEKLWEEVGKYNVLFELKRILADADIAPIASRGALKVHGWFYTSADKQLEVFDPQKEIFTK